MKITFFINYINHHQIYIADELYARLGSDFYYVATFVRDMNQLKGGFDYSNRPYCLFPAERVKDNELAHKLNQISDVCIYGAQNIAWEKERALFLKRDNQVANQNKTKISFEISERWLKRGFLNLLSPHLWKWWWFYQSTAKELPFYRLCAGAYVSKDDLSLGCYKSRHFKWGYFVSIPDNRESLAEVIQNDRVKLMWCGRFITWKHPEMAIECASMLKRDGYNFILNMYGDGKLRSKLESMVRRLELNDVVIFHGNVPNAKIQQSMSNSDIFLFTSDRQEGWGVVANEAMASRCCLVASDEIGAIPYLLVNEKNGMIFRSKSTYELYEKVKRILDNTELRVKLTEQGYRDFSMIWNPVSAVDGLLQIISNLQNGTNNTIEKGPCSIA